MNIKPQARFYLKSFSFIVPLSLSLFSFVSMLSCGNTVGSGGSGKKQTPSGKAEIRSETQKPANVESISTPQIEPQLKRPNENGILIHEQKSSVPEAENLISIPIEIFGKEGTQTAVSVKLTLDQVQGAKRLWLQTHNIRYPEKASVKINEGGWIPLNNTSAEMIGTSKIYGGVGGSFATLKMSVLIEPNGLKLGNNTITFQFNKSNGHSMGYRIVKFNLTDSAGKKLIGESDFVESIPSSWTGPSSAPADIAAGQDLWTNGNLVSNYLPDAVPIKARCASCHTTTGFDLKYFGYSNASIIERSKFHGLTEKQGSLITSYIRSLPVNAVGRPWNPPYQPGPGTSSKPNSEWAAGAGIDNVLDNDWDTIKAVFPNGVRRDAIVDGDTNNVKRYSAHDTPIAFQLPDWNHWLPEIHPLDAFGESWTAKSPDLVRYKTILGQLEGKSPAGIKNWYATSDSSHGGTQDPTGYFAFLDWPLDSGVSVADDLKIAPPLAVDPFGRIKDPAAAQKMYAVRVLRLVKIFELQEKFQLTGMGPEVRGVTWAGLDEKDTLPRAWIGINRIVFDTSPFLSNLSEGVSGSTSGNNDFNYDYLSNSWYTLQLLLNGGQRHAGGHRTVDFGYAHGFMARMNRRTNFGQAGHDVMWEMRGLDEADNGNLPGPDGWSFGRTGLSALHIGPDEADETNLFWVQNANAETKAVLSVLQQVNAEKMATWLPEQYITRNGAPFNPSEDGGNWDDKYMQIAGDYSPEFKSRSAALGTWRFLTMAKAKNLFHPALINARLNFAHAFWPGFDANGTIAKNLWLNERVTSGNAPEAPTVLLAGEVRRLRTDQQDLVKKLVTVKWNPNASTPSYNIKRSDSPAGPFLTVAFFRTTGTFNDEIPLPGRTYYYKLSTNSDTSESSDSASAAITISP